MNGDQEQRFAELFAEYVDRVNAGSDVDRAGILAAHPDLGPALLERLELLDEADFDEPLNASLPISRRPGSHSLLWSRRFAKKTSTGGPAPLS